MNKFLRALNLFFLVAFCGIIAAQAAKRRKKKKVEAECLPSGTCSHDIAGESRLMAGNTEGFIDDYHFPMVADNYRNSLFYDALRISIVPNVSRVLDVGAGSMLLSMMASKLGAAKVLGVEGNPIMSSAAKEVLAANNFTEQYQKGDIDIYEGSFDSLHLGHRQMQHPADVFVSETFDAVLIREGFLPILKHAKSSGILTDNATIIPNSAVLFGQLLESTLSLPRSSKGKGGDHDSASTGISDDDFAHDGGIHTIVGTGSSEAGIFTLEPLRSRRHARGLTVRYLNEHNAVRQTLSAVQPLFEYDFQNYDASDMSDENFAYACLIFEITEANEGVFDSVGIWFNLNMDKDRKLVLSNSPHLKNGHNAGVHGMPVLSPCWMQGLWRTSQDVFVKRGDFVRLQVVQMEDKFVFGDVGLGGVSNKDSRLIRFNLINCKVPADIYAFRSDEYRDDYDSPPAWARVDDPSKYRLGTIHNKYHVFPARVHQIFLIQVITSDIEKSIGMLYQLPDSTASMPERSKARKKIALDSFDIVCPNYT